MSEVIRPGNLASAIVPVVILDAFKDVKDAPEPLNNVATAVPFTNTPVFVVSILLVPLKFNSTVPALTALNILI